MAGMVNIVGAGPGAVDLLTLRAAAIIRAADVVLHDDLVSPEILALAAASAQVINVGKRCGTHTNTQQKIHSLMIWHAKNGRRVARLKSGDPPVFGRLGEEIDALRRADVSFEVVPGVTAASAAACAAGITLTDRRAASTMVVTTAHTCRTEMALQQLRSNSIDRTTFAVYMPGPDYGRTAHELMEAGVNADTPCAVVSQASRSTQQICYLTISDLPFAMGITAPAVLIVGKVARQRKSQTEFPVITDLLEEKYEPVVSRNQNSPY
jgi:uroporphyrin-III C-methyltransferase